MSSRVLLVDDEPAVLAAFASLFEGQDGIAVVTAKDAETALELLALEPIDLVISDKMMPKVDGIRFLSEVKQLFPEIPRVLLTGDSALTPDAVATALGERIPILSKPWDSKTVLDTVRRALESRDANNETEALRKFGGVSQAQIERAVRVLKRLQKPRPLGEILIELGQLTNAEYEHIVRMQRSHMTIVEILKEEGHVGEQELHAYLEAKDKAPGLDDRALLVGNDLVTEEAFLRALCAKHGIPFVEPEVGSVDLDLMSRTSFRYLLRHHILPVRCDRGTLSIVLSDPLDNQLLTELARIFDMPVEPRCATTEKIVEALQTLQRLHAGKDSDPASLSLQYREIEDGPIAEETGEEAVQIVDYLLLRAIQLGASDLHIEPLQKKIRVRVRVDGVLQQLTDLPIDFAPRVVSRLKILAGADIAERRLHQDGKIFVKVDGREIDIRMSSYVSVFGETVVLRLLDRNRGIAPLHEVGFTPRALQLLTDVILESSSGLVLITGPTGSGKTTTLYSFIGYANNPGEKVITCEDPVEYVIDGIVQGQVNEKTGPTFHQSLRSIVRQDPDTIVVGEVRDKATVSLALEAALTGHKVFSTFHTEDAVGAFVRLLDMGAEPFLVASAVSGVVAQRLVRRLCGRCRKQAEPSRSELAFLGVERNDLRGTRFFAGTGCTKCGGTGYKGRLPVHEVLLPNDEFRDAVLHRVPAKELRKLARGTSAFLTLQEDGILKAATGDTSLAEIISNAPRDTDARSIATLESLAKEGRAS